MHLTSSYTLFPYTTLFRSGKRIHKKGYGFKLKYNLPGDEIALRRNKLDDNSLRAALRDPYFGKIDRKSTRLNSSHVAISYAVFCLKKKKKKNQQKISTDTN